MPAPPVSRLILLLSGSGPSLRVLGQLPYPVSLGAYTGDVIQLVSLHTNRQPSVSCQFLCNACASSRLCLDFSLPFIYILLR